jgi:hypothetical protein
MTKKLAADYRAQSEACRQAAEATTGKGDEAGWRKLADQWLKLAEQVERSPAK